MNRYYETYAVVRFEYVSCPKHNDRTIELRNGILGEQLWWCAKCERPYYLKPTALRENQFDRAEIDKQLEATND